MNIWRARTYWKQQVLKHRLKQEINYFRWSNNDNDNKGRCNDQQCCAWMQQHLQFFKVRGNGIEYFMNCALTFLNFIYHWNWGGSVLHKMIPQRKIRVSVRIFTYWNTTLFRSSRFSTWRFCVTQNDTPEKN